jgi:hypothetical protein
MLALSALADKLSLRCKFLGLAFPNYGDLKIYRLWRKCYAPYKKTKNSLGNISKAVKKGV